MDQDSCVDKLMLLFNKRRRSPEDAKKLQDFVEGIEYKEIEDLVRSRILCAGAADVINALFTGLSLSNASQKKRVKLFEFILKELHTGEVSSKNASDILTWLVFQVEKLSSVHLVKICDLCVDHLTKSENDRQTSWKDLLPKLISVVSTQKEIDHYGTDMTGEAYKKELITAICQPDWNVSIMSSIAAMFVHIPLSQEELSKVTSKINAKLRELTPEEVPPLVYQMLALTKNHSTVPLFFALKQYYNRRIYGLDDSSCMLDTDKEARQQESQFTIHASKKDFMDSQAMVLYHIERRANVSLSCATELLKVAKSSIPCGEVFFDPFSLSVLLTISNISHLETQVFEALKNLIVKILVEEQKRSESDWLSKVLKTYCNVEGNIVKLIKSGACEIEAVLKGLVSFSMVLLKAGMKGDKVSQATSRFGRMIAVNIFIKHSPVAKTLLQSIMMNIMSSPLITQYTDCLGELCDNSPMLVVEHIEFINRLLDALPSLPQSTANRIINSVISLLLVSSKLRDNLILVLHKSLFLHDVGARKVAVSGFLQLLKRMKITGMHSLSQNSFQAYTCPSVLTQTVIDVHSQFATSTQQTSRNNEGLCLEIINILKRCFTQQLPIKVALYSGLNRALIQNPELCVPVVDVFLEHLGDYCESSKEKIPPLNFDKALSITETDVTITEPLGNLLFIVQQIIITADQTITGVVDDEEYLMNTQRLLKIMDSLVDKFTQCTAKHLDIDDDFSGLEGRIKEEKLRLAINVYQALIAYMICKWDVRTNSDDVKKIMALYRSFSNFDEIAKKYKPPKKDKDESSSQKKKAKDTTLMIIPGKKHFNVGETAMDFSTVQRMLCLLLNDSVPWSTNEVSAEVKGKRNFHRFALQSALDVIQKGRNRLSEQKSTTIFNDVCNMANVVLNKILFEFEEMMNYDPPSATLGVEIFTECFSLVITFFKKHLVNFLQKAVGVEELCLDKLLEKVMKPYLRNLGKALDCEEDEATDPNNKLLVTALINGMNLISMELPVDGTCINKVYEWLMKLAQTKEINSLPNVKTIMNLLLTLLMRCKNITTLHDNLALQLCTLFGPIGDEEIEKGTVKLAMVNDFSKVAVFLILCQFLNLRLDAVDWVITRAKAEIALITQPDATITEPQTRREILKRKEKEVVTELGLVVSASQWLCTSAIPQDCAEATCKLLHHVYVSLTAFTKYFIMRGDQCYQEAKFGKLVKLAASNLSTQIADFLLYIEAIDNDENVKKVSAKVLRQAKKQTVYIPKLVAELENFTKCVTQLSTKSKDPTLILNVKLTTTRDFRLNVNKLEEVMRKNEEGSDDSTSQISEIPPETTHEFPAAETSPQPGPSKVTKRKRGTQNIKLSSKKKKTK